MRFSNSVLENLAEDLRSGNLSEALDRLRIVQEVDSGQASTQQNFDLPRVSRTGTWKPKLSTSEPEEPSSPSGPPATGKEVRIPPEAPTLRSVTGDKRAKPTTKGSGAAPKGEPFRRLQTGKKWLKMSAETREELKTVTEQIRRHFSEPPQET